MTASWKRPAKLLAATDLTPASDLALERAIVLAAYWGARLTILHTVSNEGATTDEIGAREKAAVAEIERATRASPLARRIDVDVLTTAGDAAERILAKCDRLFIDLCIMGAGERRTLGQRLLGSTVDKVLRRALQPVLSVRKPSAGPYQRIAVATDFSAPSRNALECALALFPSSTASVVHAFDPVLRGLFPHDKMSGPLAERHEREMTEHVTRAMSELVKDALAAGRQIATVCQAGRPEVVMRDLVERDGIDLVIVGTHGRTGIRRAVIGSVAERLIGTLPCDVLAVPTPP